MKETVQKENFPAVLSTYRSQLKWLNSLITDPQGLRYLRSKTKDERLNDFLETIKKTSAFLDFLGNPQDKYAFLHIAGTGGKSSVTMMIGAILDAAGFKTGIHTNPYLQVPNEKWMIGGKIISPSELTNAIMQLRLQYNSFITTFPGQPPTYVIAQVALTHKIFAEQEVDFGIIETGMGGRYDPSNILNPELSIITNVDFDHVNALGPTLTDIAFHKAGIIKPGKPVITNTRHPEALEVIKKEADNKNSPLFMLDKDFSYKITAVNENGIVLDIQTPTHNYQKIRLSLPGFFQGENAALAVTACDILARDKKFVLGAESINQALSTLRFPGRMEKVQEKPTVILDGAHNPQKTKALAESIAKLYFGKKYILIIGMLATKDAHQSVLPLIPSAKKVITTQPHLIGKPSIDYNRMKEIVVEVVPSIDLVSFPNVDQAIDLAVKEASGDDIILITGSLYLLGEARERWFSSEEILFQAEKNFSSK